MTSHIKGLFCSTWIVLIFVTLSTLVGELHTPFKSLLASLTGHHWVSKGVLSAVIFFVCWFLFSKFTQDNKDHECQAKGLIISTLACSAVLFVFFIWLYGAHH
jgi:hypothetical protein